MKRASGPAAEPRDASPPPPASETRPSVRKLGPREAMKLVGEREDPEVAAALAAAGERYADDDGSREIADIQAGRHPLQRDGRDLDAWARFEDKLSAIRARRGD